MSDEEVEDPMVDWRLDHEPPPPHPTFHVDSGTGLVSVDWHGDRPETVVMTGEAIEQIVEAQNAASEIQRQQEERIEALQMLVAIYRLGRRPNAADWKAAGYPWKIDPDVRIDIMRRKVGP